MPRRKKLDITPVVEAFLAEIEFRVTRSLKDALRDLERRMDRLEKRDFLNRRLSTEDRRSFLIEPRPAGRAYIANAMKKFQRLEDEIAKHVTKADMAGFQKVIEAFGIATDIQVRVGPDVRPEREQEAGKG